jgi:hypothetical protein
MHTLILAVFLLLGPAGLCYTARLRPWALFLAASIAGAGAGWLAGTAIATRLLSGRPTPDDPAIPILGAMVAIAGQQLGAAIAGCFVGPPGERAAACRGARRGSYLGLAMCALLVGRFGPIFAAAPIFIALALPFCAVPVALGALIARAGATAGAGMSAAN